jgi:fructose/tagatose bisphosphate aldolase
MGHSVLDGLLERLEGTVSVEAGVVRVIDQGWLRGKPIDDIIQAAVFGPPQEQAVARWLVWQLGQALGVLPSSIHQLYIARGRGETPNDFSVPAMNLRAMTYDMARAVFRAAIKHDVGAMIFEIARSEIGYTDQRPAEYISSVMAAAIKEGYQGPLYVQGDHFQVSSKRYASDPAAELQAVRDLTAEALAAGFYNIDIDTSTLVDLSQPTLEEQQQLNFSLCAEFTTYIREHQPPGITVSVGGEIGEVGGKNSTEPELRAFMDGYLADLAKQGDGRLAGTSKISIQTGTSHGGVVLPDGSIAQVKVDFETLRDLSIVAREAYGMAGAVQHGASTLPPEAFNKFTLATACEVHLATGFQNMMYDHETFPTDLRREIYAYLDREYAGSRKPDQTDEQFHYSERKRALGSFKADLWGMSEDVRGSLREAWEEEFAFLFQQLNVVNTRDLAGKYTTSVKIDKPLSDYTGEAGAEEDVGDLAD